MQKCSLRLNEWLAKHGRRPALLAIALVLALWAVQLFRAVNEHEKTRTQELKGASEAISLGLMQKNRTLLESLLETSHYQFSSRSSLICKSEKIYLSSGLPASCENSKPDFFTDLISVRIPGLSDYELKLFVKRWKFLEGLISFFFLSIFLVVSFFFVLLGIQKRFFSDIFVPLQDGLGKDTELPIQELEIIRRTLRDMTEAQVKVAVADAVLRRNQQIAHDIRSPLAALGVLGSTVEALPEQERILMRASINRIKDITNNLSQKPNPIPAKNQEQVTPQLLSALIDPLLSEKRTQFRSRLGISIEAALDEGIDLCANVNPNELKRLLSNLINNSVEAIEGTGQVRVHLRETNSDEIELCIQDKGKGIPAEVLPALTRRGVTHCKEGGSGLGLFHAKTSVEGWGGSLKIESEVGKGTSVTIRLSRAEPPAWLATEIQIPKNGKVLVLDDDESIHLIWRKKFECAQILEDSILHTTTASQVRAALSRENPSLFLIDYELLGSTENGLDLIEELCIRDRSYLVTSRFEDPVLVKRSEVLGVKIVPKTIAPYIRVNVKASVQAGLCIDSESAREQRLSN